MFAIFENFRDRALLIRGWRRVIILFLLGASSVLALPPIFFVFSLIPAFIGLVWLLDGSTPNKGEKSTWNFKRVLCDSAFATGWWFGVGYFAVGLYWVTFSLLVEADKFGWMVPIVIFFLSAVFAIYIGLVTLISHSLAEPGPSRVIYLIIFWVFFEWVRSWLFTGFPWNLLGTVWAFNEPMIQFSSIFGVLGLSLVTVTVASIFSFLGYANKSIRFKIISIATPIILLIVIWTGGFLRLLAVETRFVDNVVLRLVQPNIRQKDKWIPELRGKHINNLIELSQAPLKMGSFDRPTHIIWPETATPFVLEDNYPALRTIASIIPQEGALLTGSPRRKVLDNNTVKLWNSIHVVTRDAKISSTYNKSHLVPFGEYIPLRKYFDKFFSFIKLTSGRVDFSRGSGQKTMIIPGVPPASPLICYEVIFSGQVTPKLSMGNVNPEWLLNVTNDAWFGASSGPYQHLAAAQLRAVEEGLPLVRVANTGISAIIDGYGRTIRESKLNDRTHIDSHLPTKTLSKTVFSEFRDVGVFLLIIILVVLSRLNVFRK